jgi:two-component sensor histidine kinase
MEESAQNALRHAALRSAADAIEAELNIHRRNPESRFFYLPGGQSSGRVLAGILSFMVGQVLAYSWKYLQTHFDEDLLGSGSGLE